MHARIRAELEARIRSGEWQPGTRLPTEAELRREYGVSRITVQRAVGDLAQAGLVVRYRGRGTFVARVASEQNLLRFTNLLAEGPELHGRHRVEEARVVPAGDVDFDLPGVALDAPVIWLRRVKLDPDERPAAVERQAVPFHVAPHLLDEPLEDLTTLAYFRRRGVPVSRARMYVEPLVLSSELAAALDREPGQAVFRLRRIVWSESGHLVEADLIVLAADDLRLYVEHDLSPSSDTGPGEHA